jgi:transcriptional regulator with XRE-family HTH domain
MAGRFNSPISAAALGRQLRHARLKRQLTLEALTLETGVHHAQISRIERGKFTTYSANVRKLCTFFRIKDVESRLPTDAVSVESLKRKVDRMLRQSPECAPLLWAVLDAMELQSSPPT